MTMIQKNLPVFILISILNGIPLLSGGLLFSPAGYSSETKEQLKGWFYDRGSQVYTYILWKDPGSYEILTTRKGGEEISRKAFPAEKNEVLAALLEDADRATYGGVTEGHLWEMSPETLKLKEVIHGN